MYTRLRKVSNFIFNDRRFVLTAIFGPFLIMFWIVMIYAMIDIGQRIIEALGG